MCFAARLLEKNTNENLRAWKRAIVITRNFEANMSYEVWRARRNESDKFVGEQRAWVHLVTEVCFCPSPPLRSACVRRALTLTTYELVLWERHTGAVKDLVPAVNGPWRFAWTSRACEYILANSRKFHFPLVRYTVRSCKVNVIFFFRTILRRESKLERYILWFSLFLFFFSLCNILFLNYFFRICDYKLFYHSSQYYKSAETSFRDYLHFIRYVRMCVGASNN